MRSDPPEPDHAAPNAGSCAIPGCHGSFCQILQDAEVGVFHSRADGSGFLAVNDQLCALLGYSRSELLARPPLELWADPGARAELMERVGRLGLVTDWEVEVLCAGGARRTCLASVRLNPDGTVQGTVVDVSAHKGVEARLRLQARALDAAADSIAITDAQGRIEWVNPAFLAHYGYPQAELLGRTLSLLRSGRHGPAFYADLWGTILSGRSWTGEIVNRRRDGSLCTDETSITLVLDEGGAITRFIAVKREITARKVLEAELAGHRERLEVLVAERTVDLAGAKTHLERDVAERREAERALQASRDLLDVIGRAQNRFIATDEPRELFQEVLDRVLELTGSAYGFIGEILRDPDGTPFLRCLGVTDIAWTDEIRAYVAAHRREGMEFRTLRSLYGHTLATGEAVLSDDPAHDPRRGGLPPGHPPLRAYLGMPFFAGGELVGMLGLANRPGGYDQAVLDSLAPLATTCGHLIEAARGERRRAQAEEALQRNYQTRDAIAGLLRLSLEPLPLAELAARALSLLLELPWLSIEPRAAFFLVDEDGGDLVMLAQVGLDAEVRRTCARVPLGHCQCGRAALTGVIQHAAQVGPDHDVRYEGMGPHGHYCVPIRSAARVEGVLCLCLEDGHPRSEHEVGFLEAVAAALAGILAHEKAQQAQRESEARARVAEESARMRARFLSSMSHELRTPLNAILGFGRILERVAEQRLDPTQQGYLRNVVQAGEHMLALVDDLLDLRRVEDGASPEEPSRAAVARCLHQALQMVQPLLDSRQHSLTLDIPDGLPEVACPPRALVQVVANLLSNAAKYTPPAGHVSLRARWVPDGRVRVEIADDGVGIAPEDQVHLFTYWQRVGGKHEHHMQGSGIGLALCRALIERAGGTLMVCSQPGVGSTFAFSLLGLAPKGGKNVSTRATHPDPVSTRS